MTPKNIHKIFLPPKIFIFLKTKKYWNSEFWTPQKIARAYVCEKTSEYPPPWGNTMARIYMGAFSNICLAWLNVLKGAMTAPEGNAGIDDSAYWRSVPLITL